MAPRHPGDSDWKAITVSVIRLEIVERTPYRDGDLFGSVGAYERIDAIARYAVDPEAAANSGIVDLALAERSGDGLVHFEGDVTIVRPTDPALGNRAALVEAPNRGRRTAVNTFNRAPMAIEPTEHIDPGDGFLFRHGWTVAWCGWQWDVPRSRARIGLDAPLVVDADGTAVVGSVQLRLQLHKRVNSVDLTDHHVGLIGGHQPVASVDVDDPEARLTVRDGLWGEPKEIPRDQWKFARDDGAGNPLADSSNVWLSGGFTPGRIYDLLYRTPRCPVAGTGLLAVRDLGAFLRSTASSNPCGGDLDHLLATGQSQCGRFLRTYLHLGLNRGEDGAQVYDGILAHIAGGRRGEFNHRCAQPSVQPTPSFGHRFPFADELQLDPRTGSSDGLLEAHRESGGVPKVVYTNTSAEYWRGDASLAHTSAGNGDDVDPPEDTRHYLFSSTQHGSGMLPLTRLSMFGSHGGNNFNIVEYTPLLRAALSNLLEWVAAGVEPPPNAVPRSDEGTAVTRATVLEGLVGVPGMARPEVAGLWTLRPLDLGPGEAKGVGDWPARPIGDAYPCLVSAADDDGNEIAGIRLPDIEVPLATHTGWNPRHPDSGATQEILEYQGSTVPFAQDKAARDGSGDPRPSIAERYVDEEDYRNKVVQAAEALVASRYLLGEDVATCERNAVRRYRGLTN